MTSGRNLEGPCDPREAEDILFGRVCARLGLGAPPNLGDSIGSPEPLLLELMTDSLISVWSSSNVRLEYAMLDLDAVNSLPRDSPQQQSSSRPPQTTHLAMGQICNCFAMTAAAS